MPCRVFRNQCITFIILSSAAARILHSSPWRHLIDQQLVDVRQNKFVILIKLMTTISQHYTLGKISLIRSRVNQVLIYIGHVLDIKIKGNCPHAKYKLLTRYLNCWQTLSPKWKSPKTSVSPTWQYNSQGEERKLIRCINVNWIPKTVF